MASYCVQCIRAFLAAVTVFFINMATVMGPTPPGTGVMTPAFSFTPASQTSGVEFFSFQMKTWVIHIWKPLYMRENLGLIVTSTAFGKLQGECQSNGQSEIEGTVSVCGKCKCEQIIKKWSDESFKRHNRFCKAKFWHLPSKSTSPMSRTLPVLGSWMRFMPTSMTAAPSFTMSAVISPGTPVHRRWYVA